MSKTAEELIGAFVDLSLTHRNVTMHGNLKWICKFCGDFSDSPDKVKHIHMCIVAQAKDYLRDTNQGTGYKKL